MRPRALRLLPPCPSDDVPDGPAGCRVPGCTAQARSRLGFCAICQIRYETVAARRGRLAEMLCGRLGALGDPLFAAFGARRRDLGAHVLAHLEELNAVDLYVPNAALADFLAELDARRDRTQRGPRCP